MYSIKLEFVSVVKHTKTCKTILYRDAFSGEYVLVQNFRKSTSFYPCDSTGKELPTNCVRNMF